MYYLFLVQKRRRKSKGKHVYIYNTYIPNIFSQSSNMYCRDLFIFQLIIILFIDYLSCGRHFVAHLYRGVNSFERIQLITKGCGGVISTLHH